MTAYRPSHQVFHMQPTAHLEAEGLAFLLQFSELCNSFGVVGSTKNF